LEAVIKIGGSLSEDPKTLQQLCNSISSLVNQYRFLVVPGGGKFADTVRQLDAELNLPAQLSHDMAILSMDQYGLLLSNLVPNSQCCETLDYAQKTADSGKVPIFLPSTLLFRLKPFVPSWDVTSDSIAAYVALKIKAKKLILATDVDGIYTDDPKRESNAQLLKEISPIKLKCLKMRTSVDKFLPIFLIEHPLDCYVINGKLPNRISALLANKNALCTHIITK
jgi:5-(aminomethyl)-3-furanmethanol phosphate kinase